MSVHKHEYLCNQGANCNQILFEASLGWGKSCVRFLARSDLNSYFYGTRYGSSHRVIMEKTVLPLFLCCYAPAIRRMRKGIKRCPCPSVRPSVRASVRPSVRPSFKWVLCERNSSYNLIPILLKLYRCFCQGLKMCMTFGYNPQINFCHFFHSLNLVIFGLNYY